MQDDCVPQSVPVQSGCLSICLFHSIVFRPCADRSRVVSGPPMCIYCILHMRILHMCVYCILSGSSVYCFPRWRVGYTRSSRGEVCTHSSGEVYTPFLTWTCTKWFVRPKKYLLFILGERVLSASQGGKELAFASHFWCCPSYAPAHRATVP
jgi:hypothetical protein